MQFDSDKWLRIFGIGLLVLAAGYFLVRAATMLWRNLRSVQRSYEVSALGPPAAAPPIPSEERIARGG